MKLTVTLRHEQHGKATTEITVDSDIRAAAKKDGIDCDNALVRLYPQVAALARKNVASRHLDYDSFKSDSDYANRLDVVAGEFEIKSVDLVSTKPLLRYNVDAQYEDGQPWNDWVHGRSKVEAEFKALWQMALNEYSDPSDEPMDFAMAMTGSTIHWCTLDPLTKDEAIDAIREFFKGYDRVAGRMHPAPGSKSGRRPNGGDYRDAALAVEAMRAKVSAVL